MPSNAVCRKVGFELLGEGRIRVGERLVHDADQRVKRFPEVAPHSSLLAPRDEGELVGHGVQPHELLDSPPGQGHGASLASAGAA